MANMDWVQIQAQKHRRLLELQDTIGREIDRDLPHSRSAINVALAMIRRNHGAAAERETRAMYRLDDSAAA